jgi:hypothetical protein
MLADHNLWFFKKYCKKTKKVLDIWRNICYYIGALEGAGRKTENLKEI